eukprot:GFUD01006348.1.p1 GENE.GFUD01006348.1~~GFUD01006348.1.p1  ORF type:complete len:135 (+),score=48.40 GFUD01006348.1:89-493(+)
MKVFACFLVVIVCSSNLCDGARGGARSMMNKRNKQKSRGGGGRGNGLVVGETDTEGMDQLSSSSDDYDTRPCIGLCYYRKLNGIVVDKKKMAKRRARQPCVGMCHRERKKKAKERRRTLKLLRKEKKKKAAVKT